MSMLAQTLREALGAFQGADATGVAVAADTEETIFTLEAPGARQVAGQVVADQGYDAHLDWEAADGTVLRRETLATGVTGGTWTDFDVPVRASTVRLVVAENAGLTSGDIIIDAGAQMG